jgi:hypothetical protein
MFDQARRRQVYDLAFKAYPGLIVQCRRPGYAALLDLAGAETVLGVGMAGDAVVGRARIEAFAPVVDAFASSLVAWTLADQGVQVPATRAGVYAQDYDFLVDIALTWYQRVVLRRERPRPAAVEPATEETPDPAADLEDALTEIPFTIGTPKPVEPVEPATEPAVELSVPA